MMTQTQEHSGRLIAICGIDGSGKNTQTHFWSVALVHLERSFPELMNRVHQRIADADTIDSMLDAVAVETDPNSRAIDIHHHNRTPIHDRPETESPTQRCR